MKEEKGSIIKMLFIKREKEEVDYIDELKRDLEQNSLKTAVKNIVEKYKLNKKEVYQTALEIKNSK